MIIHVLGNNEADFLSLSVFVLAPVTSCDSAKAAFVSVHTASVLAPSTANNSSLIEDTSRSNL